VTHCEGISLVFTSQSELLDSNSRSYIIQRHSLRKWQMSQGCATGDGIYLCNTKTCFLGKVRGTFQVTCQLLLEPIPYHEDRKVGFGVAVPYQLQTQCPSHLRMRPLGRQNLAIQHVTILSIKGARQDRSKSGEPTQKVASRSHKNKVLRIRHFTCQLRVLCSAAIVIVAIVL
jgi:hypothetical protein